MSYRRFPLNNVQQLARDAGALCTWDFSQSLPLPWITGPAGTGICMALSCHWIKYHAEDDSLVNKIGGVWHPRDRYYLPFNHREYNRMAQFQHRLANFPNWVMAYRNWMGNNGRRILSDVVAPMNMNSISNGLRDVDGAYALIIIRSNNVRESHAVAAYVGNNGEDACFFDPNYGEYWFQNREDFFTFFHFFSNFVYRKNHGHSFNFDECKITRIS